MKKIYLITALCGFLFSGLIAQDTYSIVAVDPATGEVGSAGASCVDLTNFSLPADFLGELFPGLGAINTQAWYLPGNQAQAATRMEAGDTPQEIIDYLIANDVGNDSTLRQYGIAAIINGQPQAAAHTGSNTDDYKSHRVGDNYSAQGNILLGDFILDAMEANFINTTGTLPEKLMFAMQGANVVGADTRCESNGTSALFAFLKVAQPDDEPGSPSLVLGVITEDGDGIEPVDSLQSLFDEWMGTNTSTDETEAARLAVFPNPASGQIQVQLPFTDAAQCTVFSAAGVQMEHREITGPFTLSLVDYPAGVYVLRVQTPDKRVMLARFVVE